MEVKPNNAGGKKPRDEHARESSMVARFLYIVNLNLQMPFSILHAWCFTIHWFLKRLFSL